MAKSTEKSEPIAKDPSGNGPRDDSTGSPRAQPAGRPAPIVIDDSKVVAAYANSFRIARTPDDELIIDFGLNENPVGAQTHSIRVSQRVITNFHTAKRLLQALHMTIQQHDAAARGVPETDTRKRGRSGAERQGEASAASPRQSPPE